MSLNLILQNDVNRINERMAPHADFFRNQTILITGGTGFFGKWLLLGLDEMNRRQSLNMKIGILSRNPERLADELPHLKGIELHQGDVLNLPHLPKYKTVIHAATSASDSLNRDNPRLMFDTAFLGTRHLVDWSLANGVENFLLTSSGAVYGRQPQAISHLPESYAGGPDTMEPRNAYSEAKRAAEHIGVLSSLNTKMRFLTTRCFAFVGPWLPMDTHFAIGNFLRNGQHNEDFIIRGDGTPRRSYMHIEDLVVWLLTILAKGETRSAYNVGSDHSVSILETAQAVKKAWNSKNEIKVLTPIQDANKYEQYVPEIKKAERELGLRIEVSLDEGLARTISWLQSEFRKS